MFIDVHFQYSFLLATNGNKSTQKLKCTKNTKLIKCSMFLFCVFSFYFFLVFFHFLFIVYIVYDFIININATDTSWPLLSLPTTVLSQSLDRRKLPRRLASQQLADTSLSVARRPRTCYSIIPCGRA